MAQAKQIGVYPGDWSELAELVKDEAERKCVRCNAGPFPRGCGGVYGVHHFDGDKGNRERWNLMPLCQRCHLSVQARVNPRVVFIGPYSPWSFPYIAGFFQSLDPARSFIPPAYDLAMWIEQYEMQIGPWPLWAPRSMQNPQYKIQNGAQRP